MVLATEDGISTDLEMVVAELLQGRSDSRFDNFCDRTPGGDYALSDEDALKLWFGDIFPLSPTEFRCLLSNDLARLDRVLNQLVNAIIHHPRFQRLEASWRGLNHLVRHQTGSSDIKIKVLSVTWHELWDDSNRSIEFDQTQFFKKVYENEFGTPGGQPFGLLLADFEIRHRKMCRTEFEDSDSLCVRDVELLASLAEVADAAFAPLVSAAHTELFGSDTDEGLDRRFDLARVFDLPGYEQWTRFRATEHSRFTGMVLPRMLMRLPYTNCTVRNEQFPFQEDVDGPYLESHPDHQTRASNVARPYHAKMLWGNPVYAFGAVAMRAFAETGWFEDILGVQRDTRGGGLVSGLPVHWFETDAPGTVARFQTRVSLSDENERQLTAWGFIPLSDCEFSQFSAFYSCPSLHKPRPFTKPMATRNEELSSQLNLLMCVSRFAHYLKVIVRDRVGRNTSAADLQDYLHRWIHQYVSADANMPAAARSRYPLRAANIRVREMQGKPGSYSCIAHIQPHVHGDHAYVGMKFVMELPSGESTLLHAGRTPLWKRISQSA